MKNNKVKSTAITVLGLLVLAAGLLAVKFFDLGSQTAPYLCIGLGCGVFGQGLGELITRWSEKRHPEIARQREIEQNDETGEFEFKMSQKDKEFDEAFKAIKSVWASGKYKYF